jgi:branched-chain amino acid transport system permease protein
MLTTAMETLLWGVAIGCIYMLLATGLNIIFGVMKLVNFAHGELLMVGAYIGFTVTSLTGLNAYASVLVAMVAVAGIGIMVERLTFRRVLGTDKLNEIFISLGLIYIFSRGVTLLWGEKAQRIPSPFQRLGVSIGEITISYDYLIAVGIVVAVLVGLVLLVKKTKIGLAMRATSQRSETAMLMGINIDRVYVFTFGLGAALAGAAGTLYGIIFRFDPTIGAMPTIIAFAIIILGGLGSIRGAVVGGLLYGIAQQAATVYLGGEWGNAVPFILLIIVLVIRPTGIFGEKGD